MAFRPIAKIKLGAALLLCGLALALCLSLAFIVVHAHHDCQGAHCPVCLHLSQATSALRSFAAAGIFTALNLLGAGTLSALILSGVAVERRADARSLVALRIRMDD